MSAARAPPTCSMVASQAQASHKPAASAELAPVKGASDAQASQHEHPRLGNHLTLCNGACMRSLMLHQMAFPSRAIAR